MIPGRPVTKKNSGRYCGPGRFRPSKAYEEYESVAVPVLKLQAKKQGIEYPIDSPCRVEAVYYMPNRTGWPDLVGLMQATADLLEESGVLENDRLIVRWAFTRIEDIDKDNPRAEIEVIPYSLKPNNYMFELDPLIKGRVENGYYED